MNLLQWNKMMLLPLIFSFICRLFLLRSFISRNITFIHIEFLIFFPNGSFKLRTFTSLPTRNMKIVFSLKLETFKASINFYESLREYSSDNFVSCDLRPVWFIYQLVNLNFQWSVEECAILLSTSIHLPLYTVITMMCLSVCWLFFTIKYRKMCMRSPKHCIALCDSHCKWIAVYLDRV